jgi:hypothetical protein
MRYSDVVIGRLPLFENSQTAPWMQAAYRREIIPYGFVNVKRAARPARG